MFLKILLIVIILISLLFLSFSFKLVFHKKQHIPKTADNLSPNQQTDIKEKTDMMQDRKRGSE
jgi:hypothetical protein